jgi:hypothetical protein
MLVSSLHADCIVIRADVICHICLSGSIHLTWFTHCQNRYIKTLRFLHQFCVSFYKNSPNGKPQSRNFSQPWRTKWSSPNSETSFDILRGMKFSWRNVIW